ncbi:hypothetical protein HDA32_004313 [Spinactinospora alkalitolerans]|uniref:DUF3592 domain-containing protein n=1 Tax=Spinactinospora alkalitolerans TaxID=687207 RepID=A0A852U2N1_9ACTN|nr:DUF3592 domain-containing protein [Spinactinospora alkalitolerans]NYE49193.1 hypothetical protein [Spinactinospora alkalitolerans]
MNATLLVLLLALGLMAFGLLSLWLAVRELSTLLRLRARGVRAEGTVIGKRHVARGGATPRFRFTTSSGEEVVTAHDMALAVAIFRKDAPVRVVYDPENPERARILNPLYRLSNVGGCALFLLIGLVFVTVSAYLFFLLLTAGPVWE